VEPLTMPISAAGKRRPDQYLRPSQRFGITMIPNPILFGLFIVSQSQRPSELVGPVHEARIQRIYFADGLAARLLERHRFSQRRKTVGPTCASLPTLGVVSEIAINNIVGPS